MSVSRTNFDARSASYLALGAVGAIACVSPVSAQDSAGEATQLQGVVVTDSAVEEGYRAEEIRSPKMTAPIVDTPRTINVLTEEVIRDSASFSFEDALRNVPGITLGAGEGGVAAADIPFIRGSDATSDVYVDGLRDVGSQSRETFAVERIEVFKGPNSAFGGRGGAGGTINIVTKTPSADTFIRGDATVGTDDFYRVTADVNQPLNDSIAVRIAALYQDAEVPGRDAVFDDKWGVAPSIAFGLDGDTQASVSYYHLETEGLPDYGLPYFYDRAGTGERYVFDDDQVDYDNFYGLTNRDFQDTSVDSVNFQFDHDFGTGWSLYTALRYSRSEQDYIVTNPDDSAGNVQNGLVWRAVKSRNSVNDSYVAAAGANGIFDLFGMTNSISFGAEYSAADTTRYTYNVAIGNRNCVGELGAPNYNCAPLGNPNPGDPWNGAISLNVAQPTRTSAESVGFYAFDTVTIVPELLLNLGVRWEQFDVDAVGFARGGVPYDVENKTDSWSWQAGLVYKPVPELSLYGSYANSASPPGTDVGEGSDSISATSDFYEPQETENFEIGAKYDLNGLLLSAAAFRTDRSDYRDLDPLATTPFVDNEARTQGVELGVAGQVGPVSLSGGYVYIDSEFRNGANSGNRLPNTAKHNVSLWSQVALTDRFDIGGGAYHTGKRFADAGNGIEVPDYWRFDAMASYRMTDNIALRLNVKNIADERYVVKPRNPHFFVPGPGRQALLTVSFDY